MQFLLIMFYSCKQIHCFPGDGKRNEIVTRIHDRYVEVLKGFTESGHGDIADHGQRLNKLLLQLPEIETASDILVETKMIYIPFFLSL